LDSGQPKSRSTEATLTVIYVSKLAKCPLTCPGDLAGDQKEKEKKREMEPDSRKRQRDAQRRHTKRKVEKRRRCSMGVGMEERGGRGARVRIRQGLVQVRVRVMRARNERQETTDIVDEKTGWCVMWVYIEGKQPQLHFTNLK
jgi:hypothetical protein